MTDQFIPNYNHNFLNDKRWIAKETDHYVFFYFKNSVAEKEINEIANTQENAYKKIIDFLKVEEPKRKIEYYFYPDPETKEELMGNDWYAQSIADEFRVHTLYDEKIKPIGPHEDTHLLSLPWGSSVGFLEEGLAEFLVGHAWDKLSHSKYVKEGYLKNLYPPLSEFMRHESWLETDDSKAIYFYSLAGLFTSFLIDNFGRDKFESFYRQTNRENNEEENKNIFRKIYDNSIENTELKFREFVKEL